MGSLPHQENKTWMGSSSEVGAVLPANAATPTVQSETRRAPIGSAETLIFFANAPDPAVMDRGRRGV